MGTLCRMSEEDYQKWNLPQTESYYTYQQDGEIYGYAKINDTNFQDLYVFVVKEERGKGYGNELFALLLAELKKRHIESLELTISPNNIQMVKILERYQGKELERKNDEVCYLLVIS